eukprot:RCo015509
MPPVGNFPVSSTSGRRISPRKIVLLCALLLGLGHLATWQVWPSPQIRTEPAPTPTPLFSAPAMRAEGGGLASGLILPAPVERYMHRYGEFHARALRQGWIEDRENQRYVVVRLFPSSPGGYADRIKVALNGLLIALLTRRIF